MSKLLTRFEGSLKYFLAAILVVVPLFPKFPFIRVAGTYVSIRIEDFLLVILTVVYATYFFKELPKLLKNKFEFSVFVFVFIGLTSLVSGVFLTQTVIPSVGVLHWLRRIEYFLPFFFGLLYFRKRGDLDLEFFLKVLIAVIFLLFVYGFGQKHFNWPVIITQNEEYAKGIALRWIPGSHINSTFAGHYDLATFLVFVLPIFITLLFLLKGFKTKLVLGVSILSGLWLIANAVSRISIVAYLLAMAVSLLLVKKYKAFLIITVISLAFFLSSGGLWERYSRIFKVMVHAADAPALPQRQASSNTKETGPFIFEDRSTSIRLKVEWPRAIRAFRKNPLLGTGYSSITLATDNDFLRLLGEVGLLGFSAFMLILFNLGDLVRKIVKKLPALGNLHAGFFAGYIGGLAGVLVNATFIDVFEASKFAIIFWLLTGIFVSLAKNTIYEENI